MAPNAAASADTFPKLLIRNAKLYGSRPSMRHKDLGIWQTWTWSEVLEIVRAYAVGLHRLGIKRGETVAIVGANRPKLYWSVMAVQMLGAVPVPVYADAVADELCFVLAHADVRFAAVEDQEQIDKIQSVMDRLPKLEEMFYDETRGLRDYDHSHLHPMNDLIAEGRKALAEDPSVGAWLDAEIAASKGSDPSIILYTSGTTGASKGVVLTGERSISAATDTVKFDKLTVDDVALAYLPLAWVGDHYLNYAQGLVSGFCTACPESADTAMQDLREIGPSFYFAPPRTLELLLTRVMIRMEDAGFLQRKMFNYFIGVARKYGERILNGQQVAAARTAALRNRQYSGLRAAQERARLLARAHRLHRRRSDRPRPVRLLPLDRPQSETALRADRSLPLCDRAAGRRKFIPTRWGLRSPMSIFASPKAVKCSSNRPACSPAISRIRTRPPKR